MDLFCNIFGINTSNYNKLLSNLELKDRTYKCGFILDRDLNAARNIKQVGLSFLKQNEGVNLLKKPTGLMPESYTYGDMTEVTRSAYESTSFREW